LLRFCSLGSGSTGNALVVEAHAGLFATRVLVDNGFNLKQLEQRLERAGLGVDDLDAVFVTHEHRDHADGIAALVKRRRMTVFATRGTARAAAFDEQDIDWQPIDGDHVTVGSLSVRPYVVPHDAQEPRQFVFSDGAVQLGLLTDAGAPIASVVRALDGVDALILECNHDAALLQASDYPPFLKARIGGAYGHLSNAQAAQLLAAMDRRKLRHVVAAHLSRSNNRPELARAALAAVLECRADDVLVADQDSGFDWLSV
jgi:phosphoribosyl 1,2-cyclic phosphodiesterase